MRRAWMTLAILGLGTVLCGSGIGQQTANPSAVPQAGDEPADPGPLATDLSPLLHAKQIRVAMRRVADWELGRVEAQPPSRSWDFAVLDVGLMAASRTLHESRYSQYVVSVGDHFGWKLERTVSPANDFAVAQAFIEVYRSSHDEEKVAPLRRQFDDAMASLDAQKPVFWSADTLFMAPPTGVALSDITSDPTYDAYVNRQWGFTEKLLYDRQAHLFSRDAADVGRHEKNGEKVYMARSNGMVMAGLVRMLANLPSDDPLRPHYIDLLRQMAAEVAAVQGSDGLWRPGLLDAASYPLPDVAGSAFFTYAMAWGIGHRMLDADQYLPAGLELQLRRGRVLAGRLGAGCAFGSQALVRLNDRSTLRKAVSYQRRIGRRLE